MHSVESACLRILHTSQRNGAVPLHKDVWIDDTFIYFAWIMRDAVQQIQMILGVEDMTKIIYHVMRKCISC